MPDKTYLGDAVYASFDGFSVILTTENGISASNTIHLDPDVLSHLAAFATLCAASRRPAPFHQPPRKHPRCTDGMCGATDCPTCFPELNPTTKPNIEP